MRGGDRWKRKKKEVLSKKGAKGERILELDFSILTSKRGYDGNKIYVFQNVQQSGEVSNCTTVTDVRETVEADMKRDAVSLHRRAVRGARALLQITAPEGEKVKVSRTHGPNQRLAAHEGWKTGNQNKP